MRRFFQLLLALVIALTGVAATSAPASAGGSSTDHAFWAYIDLPTGEVSGPVARDGNQLVRARSVNLPSRSFVRVYVDPAYRISYGIVIFERKGNNEPEDESAFRSQRLRDRTSALYRAPRGFKGLGVYVELTPKCSSSGCG